MSVLILRSSAVALQTFDYYISPTGNNASAGTQAAPWAITALASKSQIAGKRVGLLNGTYTATGSGGLSGTAILWDCPYSGTAGAPTIIEAVNARLAIFDGLIGGAGTQYTEQSILGSTTGNYVQFKNLKLKRAKQKLMYLGGSNNRVEGCDFSDLNNQRSSNINGPNPTGDNCEAIFIQGPGTGVGQRSSGNVISNCKFADILNGTNSPNAAGIKIYDSENNIVEFCTASNMNNLVFEKSNSAGTIARYNYGFTLRQLINGIGSNYANAVWRGTPSSYTCQVYQNLSRDCDLLFESHSNGDPTEQNVQIYNNTAYCSAAVSALLNFRGSTAGRVIARDNILFPETTVTIEYGDVRFVASTALASTLNYNLYPGLVRFVSALGGSPHTTLASWRTASGFDLNSAATNPNFVNKGGTLAAHYKISGAALTASSTGGPVGCYITGTEQIGCNF